MSRLLSYHLVDTKILSLATTPIDNTAWVTVYAASKQPCSSAEVYNGSNALLQIAIGAAGFEVAIPYTVLPGRSVVIPFEVSKGKRISAKAATATIANVDYLALNLLG
jgi:hypothetical protein